MAVEPEIEPQWKPQGGCVVLKIKDKSLGRRRCALSGSRDENGKMHRKEVILPLHREYVES